MKRNFLTSLTILLFTIAYGQNTYEVKEVLITATKIPMESFKTGRSFEIISREEIEDMPVFSIDELMRYLPGMNINSRGGFGVQADIGLRGSTFSQVLVLVDNIRFNDPLTGHFNSNFPVPVSEIHHIEVIKGPSGVSYGSDAVGGIIHIKTKTYVESGEKNQFNTSGSVSIGQHDLFSTDLGVTLHKNKLLVSAAAKTNISDGESFVNPNFLTGNSEDSLYNNYFDLKTYTASIGYLFNQNVKLYGRIGYDVRDFGAKFFYTRSAFDESEESIDNLWSQLALNIKRKKQEVELSAGYKNTDDYFQFNPLFPANEHKTQQYAANYTHRIAAGSYTNFAFGLQYLYKKIESTDRGNHQNSSIGAFGNYSQNFLRNMHANAGVRLEYDQNFGFEVLPQLSLSYQLNDLTLRTSYGMSIRAADFTERFVSFNIPQLTPGRNAGNPDLEAERSHSVDLGADYYFKDKGMLSATLFYRKSKNLIDFSLVNSNEIDNLDNLLPNEEYFYASNISKTDVFGVESAASKNFIVNDKVNITVDLAYTFIKTTSEGGPLSKYISNHPKHNLSGVIGLKAYSFELIWMSNFLVRQEELATEVAGNIRDQYLVNNLKISYSPIAAFTIFNQVNNITDTEYQEILGARLPGRWFSGGIAWKLEN